MRIGIDARELCGEPTGVGRYLRGLLDQWSANEDASRHQFILYSHQPLSLALDAHRFATRAVAGSGGTRWEQLQLPMAVAPDNLDVFFAPAYSAPLLLRVPLVVLIHDVSFTAHPEWFGAREGLRRRLFCRRSAAAANAIVTVSEFSKRELSDQLDVPTEKMHVIPPGITSPLPPRVRQGFSGQAPSDRALSVLYVGSIFNRRHVPELIRAFAPIARAHPEASLEVVGHDRSHPPQNIDRTISRAGMNGQVRWRQYVPDEDLAQLYLSSRAFAFLSEYEGLGMTPLEALTAGVPPLLLETPTARETCGDAALYVPRIETPAITRALEALLFDGETRARLASAAPAVLSRYDWRRSASAILTLLASC